MSPYARVEVALITLTGIGAVFAVAHFGGWWSLIPALLALAMLAFYRDPPRRVPARPDAMFAPADGRITAIESGADASGGRTLRIVIFLSVFDVHMNRSPCAGRVIEVNYRPGKFLNALDERSTVENENNQVLIEPAAGWPGPVSVRQIAGVLARRIVCAVGPGDLLSAGQRFGMIKLGSRTELAVRDDGGWRLEVRQGQRVWGGLTMMLSRQAS